MKNETRENIKVKKILVEGEYYEDRKKFLKEKFNGKITGGVIRIDKDEYNFIDKEKEFITHFNLQVCHHKVGRIYVLPKILEHGFYTKKKEQLPNLSFKNVIIGECVEVREYIEYKDLKKEDFEYSFENIRNSQELKKAIIKRYGKSLPDLSEEEILNLGVSLTKLKIIN